MAVGAPGSRALAWPLGAVRTGTLLHRPPGWGGERTAVGKERALVADDIVTRNLFRHHDDPRQELAEAGAPSKPFQLALVWTEILPRELPLRPQRQEGGTAGQAWGRQRARDARPGAPGRRLLSMPASRAHADGHLHVLLQVLCVRRAALDLEGGPSTELAAGGARVVLVIVREARCCWSSAEQDAQRVGGKRAGVSAHPRVALGRGDARTGSAHPRVALGRAWRRQPRDATAAAGRAIVAAAETCAGGGHQHREHRRREHPPPELHHPDR